jgi:hypothetical protein
MKTTSTLFSLLVATSLHAQVALPELSTVVEEVMIPASSQSIINEQVPGARTFRVYLVPETNWEVQIVFGMQGTPLTIANNSGFYQHPAGGPTPLSFSAASVAAFPELAFDSWLTIGAETNDNVPLLYILPDPSAFALFEAGGGLTINDPFGAGVYYTTFGFDPVNSPDANGRVLIAQFTSNDNTEFCFATQLRRLNPDGTIYFSPETGLPETVVYSDVCASIQLYPPCQADLNISGNVDVADLLILLSDLGCNGDCDADITGDMEVTVGDLLSLLSEFGQPCYSNF